MVEYSLESSSVLLNLLIRLIINLVVLVVITKTAKVQSEQQNDFKFSFLAIGMTVFFICFLLESVDLELGFALGLFAIFAILRYRTLQIPIKEMTYLFVIIGLAVMNALAKEPVSILELGLVNVFFITGIVTLETIYKKKTSYSLPIKYDNMENLKGNKVTELHSDLESRTGLKIKKVEVEKIDIKKGFAILKVVAQNSDERIQYGKRVERS